MFLPFIESGRIIMILATTENPSFRLTTPLQSRCRLLKLTKHDREDIKLILERAITIEKSSSSSSSIEVEIDSKMVDVLADLADGDARVALSNLEILLHALKLHPALNHQDLIKILGHKFLIYDRNGDNHYDLISALHKSIRGGDADAGLYWLARMLGKNWIPCHLFNHIDWTILFVWFFSLNRRRRRSSLCGCVKLLTLKSKNNWKRTTVQKNRKMYMLFELTGIVFFCCIKPEDW